MGPTTLDGPEMSAEEQQRFQSHFHLQLNQASPAPQQPPPPHQDHKPQFHGPFSDGDFEFVSKFY